MNIDDTNLNFSNWHFCIERISRDIDKLEDINEVKETAKKFLRLYCYQQETITKLGLK